MPENKSVDKDKSLKPLPDDESADKDKSQKTNPSEDKDSPKARNEQYRKRQEKKIEDLEAENKKLKGDSNTDSRDEKVDLLLDLQVKGEKINKAELEMVETIARGKGVTLAEAAQSDEAQTLIAAHRKKVAKDKSVPDPSNRSVLPTFDRKANDKYQKMSDEEKREVNEADTEKVLRAHAKGQQNTL